MKILLPTDGSDCARQTLQWAAETFDKQATEYYLLHVIRVFPENYSVEFDIADTTRMLNELKQEMEARGCRVVKAEYVLGEPLTSICAYADDMQVDQVVIGSHGRTGLKKMLLGSTSEALLEHCKRPVLIHRNLQPERLHVEPPHLVPQNTIF